MRPVDVTLLLEGTYPFVRGGVSSWVHRLIEALPDISFSIAFLGGRESDYGPPAYALPPNVHSFERQYLFEPPSDRGPAPHRLHGVAAVAGMQALQEALRATLAEERLDPAGLRWMAELLDDPDRARAELLHSDTAWERIREGHRRECPDGSFTDYFWTVRAMHGSIFAVAELARRLPPSRMFHAVSTGYAGLLGAILHHQRGRPLVLTEHGIYTKERLIDLASAERMPGERDPSVPGFGRRLWIRFFQGLGRIAYSSSDVIVSLYEGNQRRQIEDGADPARTRVIPNGVDVQRFRRAREARRSSARPVLGFLGRVVPIKDVKTFIRAMKAVVARCPEAEGWIVGPTSEDPGYAEECKQLVAALGLERNVKFMGFRPAEEILPQLGLVVLSSISEALPLVVLEAFATGVPVVTTDVGACRELVEGRTREDRALGPAGAVVPIAQPEAIAGAALSLLREPERWRHAAQSAVRRVETHYAEGRVVDAYRRIYEEAREWRA